MIFAAVMAATVVTASMASMCASASDTTCESTVFTLNCDSGISPAYAYRENVPFNATTHQPDSGYVTVRDAPAQITYYSCTIGQAIVTIWVNGSYYGEYTIPSSSGATISHTIYCSAGDEISYEVLPDASVGCVKTEGSFTLWY